MSVHPWQVNIKINHRAVDGAVSLLESSGFEPISWFECTDGPMSDLKDENDLPIAEEFLIQGFYPCEPNRKNLHLQLDILKDIYKIPAPEMSVEAVNTNESSYTPKAQAKKIGVFSIRAVEDKATHIVAASEIPLYLNAAMAFGTGDHPTTEMCLHALEFIKKNTSPKQILDMGCGSGILAMACAKIWPSCYIDAVDIDPVSVRASIQNATFNNVTINAFQGSHLQHPKLGIYDVILANILAKPLSNMAKDFPKRLKKNGKLIISGFLDSQKRQLINRFCAQGFEVVHNLQLNQWHALILEKKS